MCVCVCGQQAVRLVCGVLMCVCGVRTVACVCVVLGVYVQNGCVVSVMCYVSGVCVFVCVCLVAKDGWVGADQSSLSGCVALRLLGCL